jgi:hypothetical protein
LSSSVLADQRNCTTAILGLAKEFKSELFIETGRARRQSTYILRKYLPSASIISVELTNDSDAAFAEDRDARYEVPDFFEDYFLTDDPAYVEELKHLDKKALAVVVIGRGPFQSKNKPRKGYGPTLGIFVPSPGDAKRYALARLSV